MSANTLNNRSIGQTILDTFFNDIHNALDGDFVGRGATGIPTSGQNLGTAALPWGTMYASGVNISGTSLDTSKITSPVNRITSGAKRTTSNQPDFIRASGSGGSFTLKATTTNLVVDVNGAAVTFAADVVKTGLTLAPSSNNTAVVNDATAAAQAATRTWGEFEQPSITIGTVGSNITAKVGTFQAFKVVHSANTEYFIAFVESSTKLSRCFRGFFLDSSGNPVKRTVISNSDVITLLQQSYVFVTNDGSTVDVTTNTPTWANISPTSPATGDYWYDQINQTWKRYDGASFVIINRTLVGIAICDTTNCVGARSFEFSATYDDLNTMNLELTTTATIIRSLNPGPRVNAAGRLVEFQKTMPTFVGATHYASSSTDYYSAFTTSTTYYLYISDKGEQIISDMEPYYRSDLFGYYHPFNPWRCVGITSTDGSSNWLGVSSYAKLAITPASELSLTTGNGKGATNTVIRRYSVIARNTGNDWVYSDDSNAGMSVTILTPGLYSCTIGDAATTGTCDMGVSVNSSTLTTNINNMTYAQGWRFSTESPNTANVASAIAGVIYCQAGDVVRAHCATNVNTTGTSAYFNMIKIG